tara:strand:- start:407 stop:802 length:396 start_codon:yes stop_codon:yes gene_type:complete
MSRTTILDLFNRYPKFVVHGTLREYLFSTFRDCDIESINSISGASGKWKIEVGQVWHRKQDMRYEESYRFKRRVVDICKISNYDNAKTIVIFEENIRPDDQWGNIKNYHCASIPQSFRGWGKLQENLTSRS